MPERKSKDGLVNNSNQGPAPVEVPLLESYLGTAPKEASAVVQQPVAQQQPIAPPPPPVKKTKGT
jgi:hypothetical protein